MDLGIDLGTSSLKAVLVDDNDNVVATASAPLDVRAPRPLWSEQDPQAWWNAALRALAELRMDHYGALARVQSIGLSGQMHGATLLDGQGQVLRPAILWNDGRSGDQCGALESSVSELRTITGNIAMPGFTAPKLLWVRDHEPDVFAKVAKVLLPKDYLRMRLCGEYASDMSDSAGTLWMDVGKRRWSSELLAASGLTEDHMPRLVEGTEITGTLSEGAAAELGLPAGIPIAGGGGDNAAGAVGVGVIREGQAFLSLGTSGVYFVASNAYRANPDGGVHTFCHALPGRWHQMAVLLSAASCLSWLTRLTHASSEVELVAEADDFEGDLGSLMFLPYLSGERTPHNDPHAKGVFFGLTHTTGRPALVRAVLEGVALAFADGQQALLDAGTAIEDVTIIGGGTRASIWSQILADVLGRELVLRRGAHVGSAFGAARLARIARAGLDPDAVCTSPPVSQLVEPDAAATGRYAEKLERFRRLYRGLREEFARDA